MSIQIEKKYLKINFLWRKMFTHSIFTAYITFLQSTCMNEWGISWMFFLFRIHAFLLSYILVTYGYTSVHTFNPGYTNHYDNKPFLNNNKKSIFTVVSILSYFRGVIGVCESAQFSLLVCCFWSTNR